MAPGLSSYSSSHQSRGKGLASSLSGMDWAPGLSLVIVPTQPSLWPRVPQLSVTMTIRGGFSPGHRGPLLWAEVLSSGREEQGGGRGWSPTAPSNSAQRPPSRLTSQLSPTPTRHPGTHLPHTGLWRTVKIPTLRVPGRLHPGLHLPPRSTIPGKASDWPISGHMPPPPSQSRSSKDRTALQLVTRAWSCCSAGRGSLPVSSPVK